MLAVEELTLYLVEMELVRPFRTSFGATRVKPCILVRVRSRGEEGWGEVVADRGPWYSYETVETAWHVITEFVAPLLLGRELDHPKDVPEVLSPVRGHNMAKAGVEMAVWDLYSRIEELPLYRVLGGVRREVESGVSIGIQKDVDSLLKLIDGYLSEGYRRIKVKIMPGWDVNVVRRVREEYPDVPLQVDANGAYTLRDAEIFKRLDEYSLLMIEQPLSYDDLVDHAALQRSLRTPICLDESISSYSTARCALALGSCRVVNIKPGRVGGHTASLAIHDLCASRGVPCWVGGMLETGVGRAHNVALATLPNMKYPNDISASSRYYERDIVDPPFELTRRGTIPVPEGAGIGVEVLTSEVERLAKRAVTLRA